MKISPIYANRNDLSAFQKWRLTIEEKIEQDKTVRVVYRFYFFSPAWVKKISELFLFPLLVPVFSIMFIGGALKKMLGEEFGEDLCLPVYFIALYVLTYYHFSGWILINLTINLALVLWFTCLMEDYKKELKEKLEI